MKRLLQIIAFVLLAATGAWAENAGIKVEAVLSHDKLAPGKTFRLAVVMNLPEPWHANANPAVPAEFIPTTLTLETNAAVTFGKIEYPAGKSTKVSWSDDPVSLYSGRTLIFVTGKVSEKASGTITIQGGLRYQACDDQVCHAPKTVPVSITVDVGEGGQPVHPDIFKATGGASVEPPRSDAAPPKTGNEIDDLIRQRGWFLTLAFVFLGGMALNLTPCVYPMIAITVSYFGGQGQQRNTATAFRHALAYFFGVTVTYSILGLIAALTGGLFGALLQNTWVLLGIAALLLGLALSMFGLYEIQPPQFLLQRATGLSSKAGYIGVFFLGATVGVIAAPCLAPILVALLAYVSQRGDPVLGFWMFFVLACGLGLPYVVLGTFSGALSKLPKSGTWMVWVKRVFGVILVGAALWITAPLWPSQTSHWPPYTKEAVAQAAADHQPVIIDFSATWCGPCRKMERTTFRDERVLAKMKNFLVLKADVTSTESKSVKDLMTQFQIRGVPTIVFIDPSGAEHSELRQTEYTSADDLLKLMDKATQSAPTNTALSNIPRELQQPF